MAIAQEVLREEIVDAEVRALAARVAGTVVVPGDAVYDEVRQLHDITYDRRPQVIVRAASAADVAEGVRFARAQGLPLAVRSGGHNFAGYSMVDDGVTIDLSELKAIHIDPETRTARVQPGVTSGDLGPVANSFGLALTTGDAASVGIAGLTLGGGIGWMVRKHGLTIDHLLSAQVVTADGEVVRASAREHADLFWALRGGGGNFGIVTEFEFRLDEVGDIIGGAIVLPATPEVMRGFAAYAPTAPDGLTVISAVMHVPPLPFVPEADWGRLAFALLVCFDGTAEEADEALAPIRALATPIAEAIGPMPYPAIYNLTELASQRHAGKVRSAYLHELNDEVIETVIDAIDRAESPLNMVQIRPLGGAMSRVAAGETAFAHRDKEFLIAVIGISLDAADAPSLDAWVEAAWQKVAPYGDGVYVNFLVDEGDARIREAYPPATYERLVEVKRRYDPENVFRLNQNIRPA
jgi:FAD/FMN-containing dehydrogenase